ncbi:MAG: TIGR02678 family protein, partial [Acidimicrobiia bacterium]|nr:TIGR02678 family protein [Acidimicrobiia bacterium]
SALPLPGPGPGPTVADDPQAAVERRVAARHLLQRPLTCLEHDPDTFRLVRRHEVELDRWFTQRLGYRLHLGAETARLFKTTTVPAGRPLRTASDRPFTQLEYVLLALVLASTAAGPTIVSLRDLVDQVRSAAAEAEVALAGDATERRALVSVLRWMIDAGLAAELHARVDAYATDETADAVLKLRPDRIALVPLPRLAGVDDAEELLAEGERRAATRQWLRARLVEEPVLYREDVDEAEWGELRRRLGEEGRMLDEMFGLVVEARAEGVAVIDPTGVLADRRFPAGGTLGHAALLLIGELEGRAWASADELVATAAGLASRNPRWSNDLVAAPERLARKVVDLLVELRLAEVGPAGEMRLRPAANRFRAVERSEVEGSGDEQGALW